jgi:hypothetical protein
MAAARAAGETVVFQSCAHCSKPPAPGSKLRNCKGCLTVCHCTVECQRAHWPMHKRVCAERGKDHEEYLAERHARGLGSASRANRALKDWYSSVPDLMMRTMYQVGPGRYSCHVIGDRLTQ